MPAKRIPWTKLWIGWTRHHKVAPVSDHTFRVWCELLDAAGEQKRRGRFGSVAEAAAIIRRKESEVRLVVTAGLMDETENGAEMHDWDEWQRWRAEDATDGPTSPDEPTNNSPTSRNGRVNHNGTTHEQHTNGPALRVGAAAPASGEGRREKGESKTSSSLDHGAERRTTEVAEKPSKGSEFIDGVRSAGIEPTLTDADFAAIKRCPRAASVIAEAYVALATGEWGDDWARDQLSARFVVSRLAGFEVWKAGARTRRVVPITSNSRYRGDADERAELRGGTVLGA